MKEIKRYPVITKGNEEILLISDYKSVVETMQKRIDELEAERGYGHYVDQIKEVYKDNASLYSENTKLKKQLDLLKNCENCRHEKDDHNSRCEFCVKYNRWESNFEEID